MRRSLLAPVLIVLLLAGGSAYFFRACEKQSITVYTGFQGEAQRNPYLAAQRLLESMGVQVHYVANLAQLDPELPTNATVLAPVNRNQTVSQERSEALLDWVTAGGHLVVVTWSLWDDPERVADPILDPLGIQQFMASEVPEEPGEEEEMLEVQLTEEDPDPHALAQIPFADRDEPLLAYFDPRFFLGLVSDHAPAWEVSDAFGTHVLTVEYGNGYVTTLTDDFFLSNTTIGEHDHAELVYRVAHLFERHGPVWIVSGTSYPSPLALIRRHAPWIAISVLALAAFWMWSRARRFGPIRPDPAAERRRLMEHVEAAGRLQFRHGGERELLSSVRKAILSRVGERHPTWVGLEPRELHEHLAERAGLDLERVSRALAYTGETDHERFSRRVATLEAIRKSL
jgi:hypothetical protein